MSQLKDGIELAQHLIASEYQAAAKDGKKITNSHFGDVTCAGLRVNLWIKLGCAVGVREWLNKARQPSNQELYENGDLVEADPSFRAYLSEEQSRIFVQKKLDDARAYMMTRCKGNLNTETADCAYAKQDYYSLIPSY